LARGSGRRDPAAAANDRRFGAAIRAGMVCRQQENRFGDKNGRVYVVTVATKEMKMIADAPNGQIQDYKFSPKGNYVAYSMQNPDGVPVGLYWSSEDNKNYRVTPEMFSAHDAAWDPSGGYLYFMSDREYAPLISSAEFNYATNRTTQIYALTLRKTGKIRFRRKAMR
jgi:tricorn protease